MWIFQIRKKYSDSYLFDLCDTFSMKILISGKSCVKSTKGTSIDLMLLSWSRNSQSTTRVIKTGLSDCHKLMGFFSSLFPTSSSKINGI